MQVHHKGEVYSTEINATNYKDFATAVSKAANVTLTASHNLKYLDPDGDFITVSSDDDFKIMKETCGSQPLNIHIYGGEDLNTSNISSLSNMSQESDKTLKVQRDLLRSKEENGAKSPELAVSDHIEDIASLNEEDTVVQTHKEVSVDLNESRRSVATQSYAEQNDSVTQTMMVHQRDEAVNVGSPPVELKNQGTDSAPVEHKNQGTDTCSPVQLRSQGTDCAPPVELKHQGTDSSAIEHRNQGTDSCSPVEQRSQGTECATLVELRHQGTDTAMLLQMKARGVSTDEEKPRPLKLKDRVRKSMKKCLSKLKNRMKPVKSDEAEDDIPRSASHSHLHSDSQRNIQEAIDSELKKLLPNLVERVTKVLDREVQNHQESESFEEMKKSAPVNSQKTSRFVYPGVRCDTCGLSPIVGTWYRCSVCHDVNFCEVCEASIFHSHAFLKIDHPSKAPTFLMTDPKEKKAQAGGESFWKKATNFFSRIVPLEERQNLQMMATVQRVYPKIIDTTVEKIYVTVQITNIGRVEWPEEVIFNRVGSFDPQDAILLPPLRSHESTRVTVVISNLGLVGKLETFWRVLYKDNGNVFNMFGNDVPIIIDVQQPKAKLLDEIENEKDQFEINIKQLQDLFPEEPLHKLVILVTDHPKMSLEELIETMLEDNN